MPMAMATDIEKRAMVRRLRSAHAAIDTAYKNRLAVVLEARAAGMTLQEVADALGITRDGLKKLLRRAS